jgi:predicted amidohydrolase YtcJ
MVDNHADRIFVNGDVVTVDRNDRVADAVAVRDGRIAAVGNREDVMALRGPQTLIDDLEGRALLPGFIDAHGHAEGTASKLASANLSPRPIGPVASIADLQRGLRDQIERKNLKPGDWVVGMGYDDTAMAENRHPDRDDLDEVSREHPVFAVHVSFHLAAANSMALELAGISAATADREGARFRRRPNSSEPNGVLEEMAMASVFAHLPQPEVDEAAEQALAGLDYYASFGITTAQEAALWAPGFVPACRYLADSGRMPIDVVAYPLHFAAQAMMGAEGNDSGVGERFRFGGMKMITDGSIQGYTAYLSRPYHLQREGDSAYRGFPAFDSQAKLSDLVAGAYERDWQVMMHANGDAAIDMAIEAARSAEAKYPGGDRRTTIIHAQTIRDDQLDEVKKLGLLLSFFPGHVYYWGDRHRDIFLGPERAARINPMRSALDRGTGMTLHHDSPVTTPDMLLIIWAAVNRVTSNGEELGPEQRLSVREAIRGVTIDAAYQIFEEERKGSIEEGKLADLVILSRNPLSVEPMAIREIVVEETIKEGVTVSRRAE